MKQYEYKCIFIAGGGERTTRILNEYGKEGWKLVEVVWCWHYFIKKVGEKA